MARKAVVLDLDGTLLDTETLCYQVAQRVVATYGKELTKEVAQKGIGLRPLECWCSIVDALGIDATAQELFDKSEPELVTRWPDVKWMPGAKRLLAHLTSHGVPVAIATSTPRSSYDLKVSKHPEFAQMCQVVVCGDEVSKGKPDKEIFMTAAEQLGVPADSCIAIEDAPSGIQAACAAGMQVIAVPSIVDKAAYQGCQCTTLPSLLDLRPAELGLPAFEDFVNGTVPLEHPWRIKGTVVKGFGRGSKELGIPTANISADELGRSLSDAVTGIYYGWARVLPSRKVHAMVASIGYNPFYGNTTKTCEPWLLAQFDQDFYGQELRLLFCGYVRPEADFTTLEDLKQRIHEDADTTKSALQDPTLAALRSDDFLLSD